MPKQITSVLVKKYITEFGSDVFSADQNVLFCNFCETKVSVDKRFIVTQHLKTEKHKRAAKRVENHPSTSKILTQQFITNATKKSVFSHDLCKALLSANIPLNKLSNPYFKEFLSKYTGKDIPSESTLRKGYVNEIYENTIQKIRNYVQNKCIWVSIDETTDCTGRYVANVVIGILNDTESSNIFLLHSEELEKCNHSTICRLFDKSMNLLWPKSVQHDKVLLFISDAAPYMVKAGEAIKLFYSKVIHITCLAHAFHRIAETVRTGYPKVDKLIANVKKVFRKAPSRIQYFKSIAPSLSLPPENILTRWGTWIKAANYYCENFEQIKVIINTFDDNDAVSIRNSKKYLSDQNIEAQLVFIKSNFGFLPDLITRLEKQGISLADSIYIVEGAKKKLIQINGEIGEKIKIKIDSVLSKNKGYQAVLKISKILNGEENIDGIPEDFSLNDLTYMKNCPITSVDVERSFSAYKNLLTSNRQSFKFENIKKSLIVQCNFQGKIIYKINSKNRYLK
jgi:hypothetical protein